MENNNVPALSTDKTPTMILEPAKWADEMQQLAFEYIGLPEATVFLTAARRFRALTVAVPPAVPAEIDGFVVGGDIT